jgi:hypothetical protein
MQTARRAAFCLEIERALKEQMISDWNHPSRMSDEKYERPGECNRLAHSVH